jgi:hypothetical protein
MARTRLVEGVLLVAVVGGVISWLWPAASRGSQPFSHRVQCTDQVTAMGGVHCVCAPGFAATPISASLDRAAAATDDKYARFLGFTGAAQFDCSYELKSKSTAFWISFIVRHAPCSLA